MCTITCTVFPDGNVLVRIYELDDDELGSVDFEELEYASWNEAWLDEWPTALKHVFVRPYNPCGQCEECRAGILCREVV